MKYPNFKTDRLILKKISESDASFMLQYRSDPSVVLFQRWLPGTIEEVLGFIRKYSSKYDLTPGNWNQFGIYLREDQRLIGDCGFFLFEEFQAEIGYTMAPSHQRRGFGTEAVGGLLGYLFDQLNVHRIIARTDPMNVASQQVLGKLGFRQEGYFRKSIKIRDQWVDDLLYALLREERNPPFSIPP